MTKYVRITLLCLLTAVSGYSQTGYPKLIVTPENDTVVAVTIEQMDYLYQLGKVTLPGVQDSLTQYRVLVADMEVQVTQRDSVIVLLTAQRDNRAGDLTEARGVLEQVRKDLKHADRKIKWLKVQRAVLTGVIIVGGLLYIGFGSN